MAFAVINSLGCFGIDAYGVKVEADSDDSLPGGRSSRRFGKGIPRPGEGSGTQLRF